MGDFNVARTDNDVCDIRPSSAPPMSRRPSGRLASPWSTGVWSTSVPRPGKGDRPFTYWDYRAGMFPKDLGMRIDYVLATPA